MCSLLKWHLVEETKWEKNLEKVEVEAEAWLSDQKLKPMKLEEVGQFSQEKEHNWREQIVINEAGWARYLQGPLKPAHIAGEWGRMSSGELMCWAEQWPKDVVNSTSQSRQNL